ncbi:MAG: Cys-tRNA(Pro) deacylase [Clostridiales bacterium]|nr:Cys-tRNA(Pro) deacylase [Clostridiales bacterium]
MPKKKPVVTNAMRTVKAAGIDFEAYEYEADEVGENFGMKISEKTGISPDRSFKTLVIRGEKNGIMVVCIPCSRELDLKKTAKAVGDKKAEMIHVKELLGLTGYIRGGVSPIGMKKKYPTIISSLALDYDKIAVSGGVCGVALMLSPKDLQTLTDCRFMDITIDKEMTI